MLRRLLTNLRDDTLVGLGTTVPTGGCNHGFDTYHSSILSLPADLRLSRETLYCLPFFRKFTVDAIIRTCNASPLRPCKGHARTKQEDIFPPRGRFFVPRWRPPFPLPKRRFCRGEMSPCSTEPGSCSSCKGSSGQTCILGGRCLKHAYREAGRPTPVEVQKYGHGVDPFLVHGEIVPRPLPMEPMAGWAAAMPGAVTCSSY